MVLTKVKIWTIFFLIMNVIFLALNFFIAQSPEASAKCLDYTPVIEERTFPVLYGSGDSNLSRTDTIGNYYYCALAQYKQQTTGGSEWNDNFKGEEACEVFLDNGVWKMRFSRPEVSDDHGSEIYCAAECFKYATPN